MEKNAKIATHEGKYGDHPVGGAVGAAAGAAAGAAVAGAIQGAAMGAVVGVPGVAAGIVIGGMAGALAGKAVAQEVNPTTEDAYWKENYKTRPYVNKDENYDTYRPAYRHGFENYSKYEGREFDEIEPELKSKWDTGGEAVSWEKAKPATRDAYNRLKTGANK